jgi:hypothetical protein
MGFELRFVDWFLYHQSIPAIMGMAAIVVPTPMPADSPAVTPLGRCGAAVFVVFGDVVGGAVVVFVPVVEAVGIGVEETASLCSTIQKKGAGLIAGHSGS